MRLRRSSTSTLTNSERDLYERLLAEKDQHLRILVAEVDYLRATRGQPSLPAAISSRLPDGVQMSQGPGEEYLSEEDEARAMLEAEGLSMTHLPEILSGLGLRDE